MCGHSPGRDGCGRACAGSQSLHSGDRLAPGILDVLEVIYWSKTFFRRAAGRRKRNMEMVKLIAAPDQKPKYRLVCLNLKSLRMMMTDNTGPH